MLSLFSPTLSDYLVVSAEAFLWPMSVGCAGGIIILILAYLAIRISPAMPVPLIADFLRSLERLVSGIWYFFLLAIRVFLFWDLQPVGHWCMIAVFVLAGLVSSAEISMRFHITTSLVAHHILPRSQVGAYPMQFFGLTKRLIDSLIHQPVVNAIFIVVESLLIGRHVRELRQARDPDFGRRYQSLLTRLTRFNIDMIGMKDAPFKEREKLWGDFLDLVAHEFRQSFRERNIQNVAISLMEWDPELSQLNMIFANVGDKTGDMTILQTFDPSFHPKRGEGAAGEAFDRDVLAYIPSVDRKHGVRAHEKPRSFTYSYGLDWDMYVPSGSSPLQSILSVPIYDTGGNRIAVLNFSTPQPFAFSPADFKVAWRASLIFGLVVTPK